MNMYIFCVGCYVNYAGRIVIRTLFLILNTNRYRVCSKKDYTLQNLCITGKKPVTESTKKTYLAKKPTNSNFQLQLIFFATNIIFC